MIRTLAALAACAALTSGAEVFAAPPIDLDVPANLEAVQRERPEQFAKIERILAEAPRRALAPESAAQWIRTEFQAQDVRLTHLVLTSLPPKKHLAFSLDGTSYTKIITLPMEARPQPITSSGRPLEGREAVVVYTRAARGGDCNAAKRLGEMFERGEAGVTRDHAEAMKWFNAARVLGCGMTEK